jgi:carbonic anhydrase/acetyltransferase-like protein (isoleucine patch superfamily)
MLVRHRGHDPAVDPSAFVAPTATLVGDVRVGPRARVMYGAVLDAEASRVEVGECAIVCEHAVLRATAAGGTSRPVVLADHVFVGPHATLLGCRVERCVYLATGATVLQAARIGAGGSIAVGALVHGGAVVPEEFFVPPNMVAVGDPARVVPTDDPGALAEAVRSTNFAQLAFGVEANWEDRIARYEQAAEVRSGEFAEPPTTWSCQVPIRPPDKHPQRFRPWHRVLCQVEACGRRSPRGRWPTSPC